MGQLDLKDAAHLLRMTIGLVRWLTQHDVCSGKRLEAVGPGPTFDESHVRAFDAALRGRWPSKKVPIEISRELHREAAGLCVLCSKECDRLEEAHIKRKGIELKFHSQHPSNLVLLDPTCHSRYDAKLIKPAAVEHAKLRAQARLMESIDRDIMTVRMLREEIRRAVASGIGFMKGAAQLASKATGRLIQVKTATDAIGKLLAAGHEIGVERPLAGGIMMGIAFEGELDENVDAFRYIDSLAEPLPSREEFDDELSEYNRHDGGDPSPRLIAWAAGVGAAYECGVCGNECVEPEALTAALVEHWKESSPDGDDDEDEEDDEPFNEETVHQETFNEIINSGVECGDIWGTSKLCAYHANQMAKDD